MALPREELVKAVWSAMWEIQWAAKREKIPGPIPDFGEMASRCFECWFTTPGTLKSFAIGVLSRRPDLREATRRLPLELSQAVWRLISLLEEAAV